MKLGRILLLWAILICFVTIYQHNHIVKLNYEKQRLESHKDKLKKELNELRKEINLLCDYHRVQKIAQERWGFASIKLSNIITVT
jgi:cell division protein FtsL